MTVIVDTNVLLSAVIRDRLPQRVIEEIASRDDCFWIVTPEIVREYCEILSRPKFNIADSTRQRWIVFLDAATTRFETSARPPSFLRDPKDELFGSLIFAVKDSICSGVSRQVWQIIGNLRD